MNPILTVSDLYFKYPKTDKGLFDVNMKVYKGECVGVIGPNGAGKSTLLLHLNGLLKPQKGSIIVNGFNTLNESDVFKIRRIVGLVFQDPNDQILKNTVEEEVAYGLLNTGLEREEILRRVKTALETVGLKDYNKHVTFHLSYGEKKKLSIASILVMDPDILVLDEPTSNLDPRGVDDLIEIISNLRERGKTMIIATHDIDFAAELLDRCYIIDDGRIVGEGNSRMILTDLDLLDKHGLKPPTVTRLFAEIRGFNPPPIKFSEAVKLLKNVCR
ncbi:MAG: energy-coupling factor ABC transporter ATP-binding protein [Candidatus Odinarchaeum yellowstonii]|uniref:ABC transporter ATP-binding protein n=1 Tax=Odinarchaeota yellowstonii (strain LCB_4) TaxID=1841599 RepID=A0AAF0D234_ODILC|nr:MAG: energy-coupling factor ABC transporter ATP-binding protein [Candidatus Odinarchaeum yellowstonii]